MFKNSDSEQFFKKNMWDCLQIRSLLQLARPALSRRRPILGTSDLVSLVLLRTRPVPWPARAVVSVCAKTDIGAKTEGKT